MRGTLSYTQQSVAFPTIPPPGSAFDELNVSFLARDGGTYGEFEVSFHDFGRGSRATRVSVFGDGLRAFYDERIQRVMRRWERAIADHAGATYVRPEDFIAWLEAEGAVPSRYHAEGLR